MTSASVVGSATVASVGSAASAASTSASTDAPIAVEDPAHERVVGAQQRREQVDRADLRVLALGGQRDRRLDRVAGLLRESV